MPIKDQFIEIKSLVQSLEKDFAQLDKGVKAAAPRARKSLMTLKDKAHALRQGVSDHLKSLPVKSRPVSHKPVENSRKAVFASEGSLEASGLPKRENAPVEAPPVKAVFASEGSLDAVLASVQKRGLPKLENARKPVENSHKPVENARKPAANSKKRAKRSEKPG